LKKGIKFKDSIKLLMGLNHLIKNLIEANLNLKLDLAKLEELLNSKG
jgi:hypothetical protein